MSAHSGACPMCGAADAYRDAPAPVFKRWLIEVDGSTVTMRTTMDAFALKVVASEDAMVRKGLIDLGWTPPTGDRQGRQ